ncbi:MAG: hypothetical protein IKS20_05485 [Victivallales bacterium]|nr:hypothetical protein [Victivallales bacterium]
MAICVAMGAFTANGADDSLKIGWARQDITPSGPCLLAGQQFPRLSTGVADRLTVTALALDCNGEKAVMVSADIINFSIYLLNACRQRLAKELPDLPGECVFASGTHSHTAPAYGKVVPPDMWMQAKPGGCKWGSEGMDVDEIRKEHPDFVDSQQYFDLLVEKASLAIAEAWRSRKPGKVAYGLGTAVVGENRRTVHRDKGANIYAPSTKESYLNVEGHVDHDVNVLATYDMKGALTGVLVNLACPAQTSEAFKVVSADFWNEVRLEIERRFGKGVHLLPQCSAAGDQSPHRLLNCAADARMMRLRGQMEKDMVEWGWGKRAYNWDYNLARRKEIARRIAVALEDVLPSINKTAEAAPTMRHLCRNLQLPRRPITAEEAEKARKSLEEKLAYMKEQGWDYWGTIGALRRVIDRYEHPQEYYNMEMHVLRMGDACFATNSFELYLDYGERIKGLSPAVQTFLVQLAGDGTYLPTPRTNGSGYGAAPTSCPVTFQGGEALVNETVNAIKECFNQIAK